MNKIISSSVSGDIPQLSQLSQGDIAVNNADAVMWIVQIVGGVRQVVQLSGIPSFNGRAGAITLTYNDVVTALNFTPVNQINATLEGIPTAPTADPGADSTQIATTAFVQTAIQDIVLPSATQRLDKLLDVDVTEGAGIDQFVLQYSNQTGYWVATELATVAFTGHYTDLVTYPTLAFTSSDGSVSINSTSTETVTGPLTTYNLQATAFNLPVASASTLGGIKVGTTLTISNGVLNAPYPTTLAGLTDVSVTETAATNSTVLQFQSSTGKWINGTLAAVAFSGAYSDLSGTPNLSSYVTSFNTRDGAVTFQASDITGVGGALLASPAFTGTPTAPTASAGTSTTQLATTAFVANAISGLTSPALSSLTDVSITEGSGINGQVLYWNNTAGKWNSKALAAVASSGAYSDLSGTPNLSAYAPIASPAFTGTPTAPTASAGTSTTQLATTAFVAASKYYDVQGGAVGAIQASQILIQFVTGRTVTFPAGLTGSVAYAAVTPTSSATFTITVNNTNVGSFVIAAGATTATFTMTSAVTMTPGQVLVVTAPATADATLGTLSFTLLGIAS